VIEQHPLIGIGLVAALFTLASATVGETRLEPPPEVAPSTVVLVHTPAAVPHTAAAAVTATPLRGTAVQVETTTTIPEPRRWTGPIPAYYGGDTGCTPAQAQIVADHYWRSGASDDTVLWALTMISRESTCNPAVINNNRRTGDDSWGLCQINVLAGHFRGDGIVADYDRYRFATDFEYNVAACVKLWTVCGRGPWNYGDYYCKTPTA